MRLLSLGRLPAKYTSPCLCFQPELEHKPLQQTSRLLAGETMLTRTGQLSQQLSSQEQFTLKNTHVAIVISSM